MPALILEIIMLVSMLILHSNNYTVHETTQKIRKEKFPVVFHNYYIKYDMFI